MKKSLILNVILILFITTYLIYYSINHYFNKHYLCNEEGYIIRNGKAVELYPKGTIMEEGEITDCYINGVYKIYYEDGKLKSFGLKEHGNNIGIWQSFDKNGILIHAIYYNKSFYYNIPLDSFNLK